MKPSGFYVDPKPFVFALFSHEKKKSSQRIANCLIFNVDQPGLEPGTSRL